MSTNKTTENNEDVTAFLDSVAHKRRREDSFTLLKIMEEITQEKPKMWGSTIVGFGNYHYRYESGREGDFFLVGFSPRKQSLTLYIMTGFNKYASLLSQLGKHKTGKSCLYINKLEDIDLTVLKEMIHSSYEAKKQNQ